VVTGAPPRGTAGDRRKWNTDPVTPEDLAHLRRARDLMDREYAKPLDVPAMARQALMSPSHFSRQFRAAYGETPYTYLMTRRIERAMALLRRGDLSCLGPIWMIFATEVWYRTMFPESRAWQSHEEGP